MSRQNNDNWNKHKWRRDTSWWEDLEVDPVHVKQNYAGVFEWLEEVAPNPYEHDYVLYTDGSGCDKGWGGYAAVYERIELDGEFRQPVSSGVLVAGTYGSTVQRSEFNALLDGVHAILTERCAELALQAESDEEARYRLGTQGPLHQFTGPDRITILWYTDRNNLAQCFLYDEKCNPLASRSNERDLWLRWSFMAKHVCITPMCLPRNVVGGQAVCDRLAGAARALIKGGGETLAAAAKEYHPPPQWLNHKSQKARF